MLLLRGSEPLRTFKTEAHVIPEMFGCRDLLTNEECDQCNADSGRAWEAELGHFTLGDRAFGGVRKKTSAAPKIKVGPGSYIGGQKAGAGVNIVSMGREIFRITGPNTAEIDLPYNAAHPSRAAKAVAKMAWLMLSLDQRLKHHGISAWLAGGSACETQVYHVWMACRVPTTVAIWEPLGDDRELAEIIVMLAFGNVMLLWAPPDWETGATRDLLMPPFPRGAAVNGRLTARRYNAEEHTRTKAGSRTIGLSFETMWRVHLTAPTPVEVVVREGEKESRLLTTAVSPPGATPEQPHFQLRGGDLVGSIEVKTHGESWSWSYQARPSDGDVERTIEVMNATARGGSVAIACTSDHQLILNVDRFDRPGDDNRDVSPLVEIAYNVGIVNRRFGLEIEMMEFSDDDLVLARWLALGVTYGSFQEEEPDGERSVSLGSEAIEELAATVGNQRRNISFANENTRCQLFTTDIVVGQTQLVLFDARVVGDWETLLADARAHGRVFVTFECSRVGHIFDDMFTGRQRPVVSDDSTENP